MTTTTPAQYSNDALQINLPNFTLTMRRVDIQHCWNGISFRSEYRAESHLQGIAETINEMADRVLKLASDTSNIDANSELTRFVENYLGRAADYRGVLSRRMSSFITGPSNFPVERQRKLMYREQDASESFFNFPEVAYKAIVRRAYPHGKPGDAIRSNDPEAVTKLRLKLDQLQRQQDLMKKLNAAARSAKTRKETPEEFKETLQTVWPYVAQRAQAKTLNQLVEFYQNGQRLFESFTLTNNNAKIKATAQRLAQLEKVKAQENHEQELKNADGELTGVVLVANTDEMRYQIIFDGKPSAEVRKVLKSNGMRWAPSNNAWQRHLNGNGAYALKHFILPKLRELLPAKAATV